MKNYSQSPLPFQGQKRKFIKHIKEALKAFPDKATYVDLFGGSGLLSHTIKQEKPLARVIWNDYDNFANRLECIPITNEILAQLRPIVEGKAKRERIDDLKPAILEVIQQYSTDRVDFISLSANLLFSGKYATSLRGLEKENFYNSVIKIPYNSEGYLHGVERRSTDYKELIHEFANTEDIVFILDPPYLSTDISSYTGGNNWKLKDYLQIVKCLNTMPMYVYFSSNKSQLLDLFDFLCKEYSFPSPFQGTERIVVNTGVNYSSTYEDIMTYKTK
jgi:D12 class N6 adenine-specific DNA methyltransferase family protein